MDDTHGPVRRIAAAVAGAGLVLALVFAVWGVYRRAPRGRSGRRVSAAAQGGAATALHIRLRRDGWAEQGRVPVQLYPINMTAARNEFDSERRPGQRFEDFVTRQMAGRQPLTAELDEQGETVVTVPPGRWWVHATVSGERELSWRLPVNVNGGEKSVELNEDNAYTRAKRF
ncbi:MAG TPA: hypothetical protein VGX48_04925 [Pyrinomonadaceae bacterium]|jgi:hypothetical protein|nr:hypothetical protein [Pyrinomonadaceae bacterium]